jgi:nucleoside-diphosphate-sugar epimerase
MGSVRLRPKEQHFAIAKIDKLNITVVRLGLVYGPWEYDTGHRDTLSLPLKVFFVRSGKINTWLFQARLETTIFMARILPKA